jgi:glycosyltransferase involved in cell wall biosynthesis
MRIGIFSDVFYPYLAGGGETRYYHLTKHLVSFGDDVLVVTSRLYACSPHETLFNGKLQIHRVGFPPHPTTKRSILPLPGYLFSSILHARLLDQCDILDLNTYASALAGKLASFLKKRPSVITVHDLFAGQWSTEHDVGTSMLGAMAEKLIGLIGSHGFFITVSESTKRKMIRYLKLDKESIFVVPNGVDFEAIRRLAQGVRRDSHRLAYVGRLVKYKNVKQVLELVVRLRDLGFDAKADIIGDGPERSRLESLASQMQVSSHVRFWGFLKRQEDVIRILSSATVLVNPSVFEGFGMVLLEAMAAGTPVVAYDLEAYQEYAKHKRNCLLAPVHDFEQFANNVKEIILDPAIAGRISGNGTETAKQFAWDKMAQRMRMIYSLLAC